MMDKPTLPEGLRLPWETGPAGSLEEAAKALVAQQEPKEGTPADEAEETEPSPADEDEPVEKSEEEEPKVDEDEDEPEPEPLHKVKVDGEELEVSLDELKKGYSRTQDYTRKTQRLAEELRSFEAERESVRGEREKYKTQLTAVDEYLASVMPQEPDWNALYARDKSEYAATRLRWNEMLQSRQAVQAERQRIAQAEADEAAAALAKVVELESAKLVELVPEWKDPAKARVGKQELFEFGLSLGFTEQQLEGVTDARVMMMMRESMLYRQLKEKGSKIVEKAAPRPTLKPGTPSQAPKKRNRALEEAQARFNKSHSVEDAAELFERMSR